MKKILFVLMVFVLSAYSLTLRTWSSSGSTDMNDAANYTGGSGAITASDSLLFDATSVINATATADISCGAFVRASAYSGNTSFGTYVITVAKDMDFFANSGTLNLGGGITYTGGDTIFIGAIGAITGSSATMYYNPSDTTKTAVFNLNTTFTTRKYQSSKKAN